MNAQLLDNPVRPALLTIHELCGIFNKDRRAVEKLGIPRVVLGPGEYRYDPADVEAFIASRKEGVTR